MVLSEVRELPMGFAGSFSQTMKTIAYRVVQLKFTSLGWSNLHFSRSLSYLDLCMIWLKILTLLSLTLEWYLWNSSHFALSYNFPEENSTPNLFNTHQALTINRYFSPYWLKHFLHSQGSKCSMDGCHYSALLFNILQTSILRVIQKKPNRSNFVFLISRLQGIRSSKYISSMIPIWGKNKRIL